MDIDATLNVNGAGELHRSETPLRGLELEASDGCRLLSEPSITYRDGGELRVLEVLTQAEDLSSMSDELLAHAENWPERYHLDPARAHVLRPLSFGPGSAVLEIGSGCGAVSRFLGEQCELLDAVEPMSIRARCVRERTRDLANVEVFVGNLADVPLVAAYDVVVIMGVLEYVGAGSAEPVRYLDFLARAAGMLRPGGTLIIGIENRLGVKYLCGAPEDHSGRPFESVEGYDQSSPARTFSRRELEGFVRETGLSPTTLGLFPDYKLTRLVFADGLLEHEPHMAVHIPHFPSPDWTGGSTRVANEARVWSNLVDSGLGMETANSFLILGHQGPGPSRLWLEGLLAVYYPSAGRRMVYALETSVVRQRDETQVRRRLLINGAPEGVVRLTVESGELAVGEDLLALMARTSSDEELATLLDAWVAALDRALTDRVLPALDLLPHNAIITPEGTIRFIDAKWDAPGFGRNEILARAALESAARLAGLTSPDRWPAFTLEGLALHIGAFLNLSPATKWLAGTLDREARFQAEISVAGPADSHLDDRTRRIRAALAERLARPLTTVGTAAPLDPAPMVRRLLAELRRASELLATAGPSAVAAAESAARAEERARALEVRLVDAEVRGAAVGDAAEGLRAELAALHRTRGFRYTTVLRRIYARLRRKVS